MMNSVDINIDDYSNVHFIGLGGISMSALAEILIDKGVKVSGSDSKDSAILQKLKSKGANVYIGHKAENIKDDLDLIVYTDAISADNPEFLEAKNKSIMIIDRGNFLGQLMRRYKNSIAISGTHGKTTTTGMLSTILHDTDLDPTILLGGQLDCINGNVRIGGNDLILTEACEYKRNILKFHATIGVILNVEADHLDYYKDLGEIVETFKGFVDKIPKDGIVIVNGDDPSALETVENAVCQVLTFGIDCDSTYKASDVTFNQAGVSFFNLTVNSNKTYPVVLNVTGMHNVYNAIAAIASAHASGLEMEDVIARIADYNGTHRRLESKGSFKDVRVIDDYAHHPTEILAALKAVKNLDVNDIWCIFQPHTYTRTKSLLKEFSESFSNADKVIVCDIYAAREKDTGEIHSKQLVNLLKENNVDAMYFESFEEIKDYIKENIKSGDLVLTMGAGDVYTIGEMLVEQ